MTLMIEMSRNDELRSASAAFKPNFMNAAKIIAYHQERGALKSGNPAQFLSILIAPMMVSGMMMSGMMGQSKAAQDIPRISPKQIVDGFLRGYQAT